MKIALLGPKAVGKTSYFSALYHEFNDAIVLSRLEDDRLEELRRHRVKRQVGFQFTIEGPHSTEFRQFADRIASDPMEFPYGTLKFKELSITAQFQFRNLAGGRTRSYGRDIEVIDHPGGALVGEVADWEAVLRKLKEADVFITFLDASVILEPDPKKRSRAMALGGIGNLLNNLSDRLEEYDILPIVFVVSKFDLVANDKDKLARLRRYLHEELIEQYSAMLPSVAFFVCPVALVEPNTESYMPMNLEWPFLFAAGASIMRNSHLLRMRMEQEKTVAENKVEAAESRRRLRSSSPFKRLFQWFNEDLKTVGAYEREAVHYRLRAARSAELAQDDRKLAEEIWESVRDYSDLIGALTYHDGKKIDIEEMMEAI